MSQRKSDLGIPLPYTWLNPSTRPRALSHKRKPAERIVQALHEAGHSCGLADKAYPLSGVDLPTRRATAIYDMAHGKP